MNVLSYNNLPGDRESVIDHESDNTWKAPAMYF